MTHDKNTYYLVRVPFPDEDQYVFLTCGIMGGIYPRIFTNYHDARFEADKYELADVIKIEKY